MFAVLIEEIIPRKFTVVSSPRTRGGCEGRGASANHQTLKSLGIFEEDTGALKYSKLFFNIADTKVTI